MTAEDERQFARAVIGAVLDNWARAELAAAGSRRTAPRSRSSPTASTPRSSASAGCSRCWTDPEVENIDINGCDRVFVGYADGPRGHAAAGRRDRRGAIELVQILGAYSA
jgi:hypothetical protein